MKQALKTKHEPCLKCQKCMHACRFDAIHLLQQQVQISDECTGCGVCVKTCDHRGIQVLSAPLEKNKKVQILLLPTVFFSQFHTTIDQERALGKLYALGFDDVVFLHPYEALYFKHVRTILKQEQVRPLISNHCPVVMEVIRQQYESLEPQILPFIPLSEFAASQVIAAYEDKGIKRNDLELVLAAECVAKLQLAKLPTGNDTYEVDKAIALNYLYEKMLKLEGASTRKLPRFTLEAILAQLPNTYQNYDPSLRFVESDGVDNIKDVLELCEFEQFDDVDFISISACNNACSGGNLLWRNSYLSALHLRSLEMESTHIDRQITLEHIRKEQAKRKQKQQESMKARIAKIEAIETIYEQLPMLDCKACGLPNCWKMAEQIQQSKLTMKDCKILGG
ncbi:MAG: [Fe-Fe] hydrogenase large subunit C-terminal domain-containing protein [Erysipelotrichaceae bacterium]